MQKMALAEPTNCKRPQNALCLWLGGHGLSAVFAWLFLLLFLILSPPLLKHSSSAALCLWQCPPVCNQWAPFHLQSPPCTCTEHKTAPGRTDGSRRDADLPASTCTSLSALHGVMAWGKALQIKSDQGLGQRPELGQQLTPT